MADFSVDLNGIRVRSDEIKSIANKMDGIEAELNSIASSLAITGATASTLKKRIREIATNTKSTKRKISSYSQLLAEIVEIYRKTENRITNNADGKSNRLRDLIGSVSSKLRELSKALGLDKCSLFSQDPVNLNNGNFIYEKDIMTIDSENEFTVHVFYNNLSEISGGLGRGWTHCYEPRLEIKDDICLVTQYDGSSIKFLNSDGEYYALEGADAKLVIKDDKYIVVDHEETVSEFNKSGSITKCSFQHNTWIKYEYENDRLVKVIDKQGNYFSFEWNEEGFISSISDSAKRITRYEYQDDTLVAIIDPVGRKTTFLYDDAKNMVEIISPRGLLAVRNTYDEERRCISQEFEGGAITKYEYNEFETVMTEANGNVITYVHDALGRNIKTIYADGEESFTYDENNRCTSVTDKLGNVTNYEFNERGCMVAVTNAVGDVTNMVYTENNQLEKISLNGDVQAKVEYDEHNRIKREINALGGVREQLFDEEGEVAGYIIEDGCRIEMSFKNGYMTSVTNSQGGRTSYEYDELHRVSKTIDPLGNETSYVYNDADELVEVVDATGAKQTYKYDESGNLIESVSFGGAVISTEYSAMNKPVRLTDAMGNSTYWTYDEMWNPVKRTEPNGAEITYEYDALHRMIACTDANGGVNRLVYDANGNLVKRTDATGAEYYLGYDPINRVNQVIMPDGGIANAEYDAHGNVTRVIHPDGSEDNYEYDVAGNIVYEKNHSGAETRYIYNNSGAVVEVADSDGWQAKYMYYPGGLMQKEILRSGLSHEFYYDANENLVRVVTPGYATVSLEYDCLNRVTRAYKNDDLFESYEYDAMGNIIAYTDALGNVSKYSYNLNNALVSVTDELGNVTNYTHDNVGHITEIIQEENAQKLITTLKYDLMGYVTEVVNPAGSIEKYSYDANGRIISKTDADGRTIFVEYNLNGTEKSYAFGDGRRVELQYNALKQLIKYEDWLGTTEITRNEYGYPEKVVDANSNTIAYTWGKNGERLSVTYPDGSEVKYKYNEAKQLIATSNPDDTISYSYDMFGRLNQKKSTSGLVTNYQYNSRGLVEGLEYVNAGKVQNSFKYQYDLMERKSGVEVFSGNEKNTFSYLYDARGSLAQVLKNDQLAEKYSYDARGNRVQADINGRTIHYVYNILNQMISMSDMEETKYEYDYVGNLLTEKCNDRVVREYQYDALGFISGANSDRGHVSYNYDGIGRRIRKDINFADGAQKQISYTLDFIKDYNNILQENDGVTESKYWWDDTLVGFMSNGNTRLFATDDKMSPMYMFDKSGASKVGDYDAFGFNGITDQGNGSLGWCGYMPDEITGLYHVNRREYNPRTGSFVSPDIVRGTIVVPLTINSYMYCKGDPVNMNDPSGAIFAWLAGGIVGAATNVVSKVAGDVVNSVKNGKITVSSWQDYVGTAAGGFTQGSVYVAMGGPFNPAAGAVAGAAGGAVESLATNGLKMATGVEGYRKEDGYTWKNLATSAVKDTVTGAVTGFAFQKIDLKIGNKKIKIPGVTSGNGSWSHVWRTQIHTAAKHNIWRNLSAKTVAKGLGVYAGVGFLNGLFSKGEKALKEWGKGKLKDIASNLWDKFTGKTMPGKDPVEIAAKYLSSKVFPGKCAA